MSDSVLSALGAHVAAAAMTLLVVFFDTPLDLYARISAPKASEAITLVPAPEAPPGITPSACLDRAVAKTREQTEFCVRLISAAVTELEQASTPLGRQTTAALEEIRAAAANRCRDLWRKNATMPQMPDSPSCLLSALDVARTSALN